MSGRHSNRLNKKKTTHKSTSQVVIEEPPCQELPDTRKEDHTAEIEKDSPRLLKNKIFDTAAAAVFISILALFAYFWQACIMRKAMRVDQRAWVNIGKTGVPVFGKDLVTPFEIKDLGKTPARNVQAFIRSRPIRAEEQIEFNAPNSLEIRVPILFPQSAQQFPVSAIDKDGKDITLEPMMHADFLNGSLVLVIHGEATYDDIFDLKHSMRFCEIFTDTPGRPLDKSFDKVLRDCLAHNGIDPESE